MGFPFSKEASLTAADVNAIKQAIGRAYPSPAMFYLRLRQAWGFDSEYEIGVAGKPFRLVVDEIGDLSAAQGKLLELLAVVVSDDREENSMLAALADAYFDDKQVALAMFGSVAEVKALVDPPSGRNLQKAITEQSRLLDLPGFIAGLETLSHAICRIDTPTEVGTGFLIGPRAVLTNHHVVKDDIGQADGTAIQCTFDYATDRVAVVRAAAAGGSLNWLVAHSPYSQSDLTGQGDPASSELDFALIRLATPVEPTRLPLPIPPVRPIVSALDYLIIGQHPRGKPAELSLGQVVELPRSGLRYRYNARTEPGSSGSPVLNMDLALVALHHAADPALLPKYNQGVPIPVIMAALKAANIDPLAL